MPASRRPPTVDSRDSRTGKEERHAALRGGANVSGRATYPAGDEGTELCLAVVGRDADEGVTWVHSYVSEDKKKTFWVYDAPTPEAIRKTAARNDLPIDRITQVRVLDPYLYA